MGKRNRVGVLSVVLAAFSSAATGCSSSAAPAVGTGNMTESTVDSGQPNFTSGSASGGTSGADQTPMTMPTASNQSGSSAGSSDASGDVSQSGSPNPTPSVDASLPVTMVPIPSMTPDSGSAADASGNAVSTGTAANPFGCKFGWGEPSPGGSLSSYSWLQFMTNWAGSSVKADGSVSSCETCGWLSQLSSTNIIPAYYAYIIGFYGHANGLPDQNQTSGKNLATGAGALLFGAANASCSGGTLCESNKIVQAYAYYAQQSYKAWPTKPLLWLLEGDYVQYSASTQSRPLTYSELGQLAALITKAIKSNMPNALVGMDHSTWNSDQVTNSFWAAMAQANMDFVWTTGVGNNNGFISSGTNAQSYNGTTCQYSYLHKLTGKSILVDESAGLSQASDTWSTQSATTINARIAEGVIGINVSGAPSNYSSNVTSLSPQLSNPCK